MKKFLMSVSFASVLLATGGCIFTENPYVENAEFDLELPKLESKAPQKPIRLGVFKNLSGSDRRFMVRRGDGQVMSLEYQRWRLSPEIMLMRCMYGVFQIRGQEAIDSPQVSVVIYRFEFDDRDGKAHLAADFMLTTPNSSSLRSAPTVRVDVAVPVKGSGDPAAARAEAMSKCAELALSELAAGMAKLK